MELFICVILAALLGIIFGLFFGPAIRILMVQLDAEAKAAFEIERKRLTVVAAHAEAELATQETRFRTVIQDLKNDVTEAEAKVKAYEMIFKPANNNTAEMPSGPAVPVAIS